MATERIVPLDRARTFITLLVVLHHSVVNYTVFGNGDRMRWLGFDLIVLFNDSFFMACMFFISGLFVRDSLARRGPRNFLGNRAWRLGVPFTIAIFVVTPIAYYASFLRYHLPGTTDFNFFHFWWHTLTVGPWPSGSAWFLWVLLALGAIAALLWVVAPRMIEGLGQLIYAVRDRPMTAFVAFLVFSIIVYLHHNWLADFNSPPLWWRTAYGLAFAMFSAAMTFTVPAVFLRLARSSLRLLDAMQPSAYGIYLLHFIFLIWLQYIVYDPPFPAFVKFAIVFTGTFSMSWVLTVLLRKIPVVARTI